MSTPAILRRRRDTAADWTANNPTPEAGQLCLETDTGRMKLGDGATAWNSLGYIVPYVTTTDRLLGRDTAGAGSVEQIALDGGLEFTGGPGLRRSALTGDVTASAGSNSTTIANDAVTYAKMQNVSATDKVLGRSSSGSGDVEEIACTAAGRALIDDADASAQRTTLGFGTDILRVSQIWLASPNAGVTLSDVAAADAFLGKSNRNVQQIDLTDFTQARMTVRVTTGATAGTKLVATYHTAFSTTVGDYVALGTSAIECALSSTGVITSSWIDLAAGAKADVFTTVKQTGGDGATDPVIAFLEIQFRRR